MSDKSVIARTIQITNKKIQYENIISQLHDTRAGGIALFIGTTRQWTDARETVQLAYDCYEPMALKEMHRIADQAIEQWPIFQIAAIHRVGIVPAGEASVFVGVATPHRKEAFAATRFLIDTLKEEVPIWKREHYADGTEEWIQGGAPNRTL